MRIWLYFVLAVVAAAATAAQDPIDQEAAPDAFNVGTSILTSLLSSEQAQNKLGKLYDLVDLKVRFVQLVRALFTRDNFILLRHLLEFVQRVCSFTISFLPDPEGEPGSTFLETFLSILSSKNNMLDPRIQRVNRETNLTHEELELFDKHKDDVMQVAKLIYSTP